jgi:hypothetical protein
MRDRKSPAPKALPGFSYSDTLSYRGTERRNRRVGYNLFEDDPGNREEVGFSVPTTKRLRNVLRAWARASLDAEYIILAFVLTLIGVSGIVLFNGAKTPAGDSCYCIIPSPEASAMQGTAGILLIFGVMFIPIGILKGGLPGRRTSPPLGETVGSGRTYSPQWINSGGQTVLCTSVKTK